MNYRTGDVVCGCRLEEECGRGSYGVVFVGVDTIGVRRAVKLIPFTAIFLRSGISRAFLCFSLI